MIEAVLFDWDGVLVDSLKAQHEWFNYCCNQFNKEYPFDDEEELRKNLKEPFYETFKDFGINWEEKREEIIGLFHDYMNEKDIPLKKGIEEVILELKEKDKKLGVVSSNREEVIGNKLREMDLYEYFGSLITFKGSDKYLKPNPRIIEVCLERLNVGKERGIYIGDQPTDIEAANRLGVKSIGVTWGFSEMEELEEENPDYIVDEPNQILEIVTE